MTKQSDSLKSVMLLALAVLAFGGGMVYWQYSARGSAQARVAAIEAEIPDEQQVNNDLQKSQTQLTEYRNRLDHLERSVPSEAYIPTLLSELDAVGEANNIVVTGVRPLLTPPGMEQETEDQAYQELEIDITGQGTYRAIMNLMAALQTFPKVMAVKTVGLAPRQDLKSSTRELDVTVRLKAYVFQQTLDQKVEKTEDLEASNTAPGGDI